MTAQALDGKKLAQSVRLGLKQKIAAFPQAPGLAVIIAGNNPASEIYVRSKEKACRETGIIPYTYRLPADTSADELLSLIQKLNASPEISGILVQLPLPAHLDTTQILGAVAPEKDVDGFHAVNAGNLLLGNPCLAACTPSGIISLIKSTGVEINGKNAVVVGRSNIVGKPVAVLLLNENATVTVCHSKTADLKKHTLEADILVVAVGIKEFIKGDMIKKGAVVIDVGMNRADGKLYGDVEFDSAKERASFITPVPGGVGPMTITMLLKNTVKAANLAR